VPQARIALPATSMVVNTLSKPLRAAESGPREASRQCAANLK